RCARTAQGPACKAGQAGSTPASASRRPPLTGCRTGPPRTHSGAGLHRLQEDAVSQPETDLVNRIRKAVKAEFPDAYVVKIHGGPYQSGGLPDLAVILHGRYYGFEVKKQRLGESAEHAYGRAT